MIAPALLLWLAQAPTGETRLAATAGVPWGASLSCTYLYRGPCGVPASAGVRFEQAVVDGALGRVPTTLRLGAGLDVQGSFGGGPGTVFALVPMGLVRWGVWLTSRFELSASAAVGVAVMPAATQVAMLFVNPSLAAHLALGPRWFLGVEAGPFAGWVVLGARW